MVVAAVVVAFGVLSGIVAVWQSADLKGCRAYEKLFSGNAKDVAAALTYFNGHPDAVKFAKKRLQQLRENPLLSSWVGEIFKKAKIEVDPSARDGGVKTEQERLKMLEESELLNQKMLMDRIRHVHHSVETLNKIIFADQDFGGRSKTRDDRLAKLAKVEKATDAELAASKKRVEQVKADSEALRKAIENNIEALAKNDEWRSLLIQYKSTPGVVLHGVCDLYGNIRVFADRWKTEMHTFSVRFEIRRNALGAPKVELVILSSEARDVLPRIQEVLDASFKAGEKPDGGKDVGGIDVRAMSILTQQASAKATLIQAKDGGVSLRDLDRQWIEIRTDMAKGEKPYQKMKAFVEVCNANPGAQKQLKAVTTCVANLVKHDEEEAVDSSAELKEVLAQLG